MSLLIGWLISAVAIMVTAYILPGVMLDGVVAALVLAVVLGAINTFLKPLIFFFTLPINILTLGLFSLVINAAVVMLADVVVPGFSVANFWWALLFALVLSIVSSVLGHFGKSAE